jgi:hypothetical protein
MCIRDRDKGSLPKIKQTKGGAFKDADKYSESNSAKVDVQLFDGVKRNIFSFHSPETTFRNPFLSATELKVYGEVWGNVTGRFKPVDNHPKDKFITDVTAIISNLGGISLGVAAARNAVGVGDALLSAPITAAVTGILGSASTANPIGGALAAIGPLISLITIASYYWMASTQNLIDGIEAVGKKRQFAYQYVSHGFYNNFIKSPVGNRRREIIKSLYVDSVIQDYDVTYKINNLFRANTVTLTTNSNISDPSITDNTLFTIGQIARSENGRPDLSVYGDTVKDGDSYRAVKEKDIWKDPSDFTQNSITLSLIHISEPTRHG